MVIRCERCSTMYELDESLLAPTGSEVQCTRCQHVFTAYPPSSAGRTLVGVPAQPQPPARASPGADEGGPTPSAAKPASTPGPAAKPPDAPATAASRADGAAAPRPVRSSTPAIYRPAGGPAPTGPQVPRAPVLKRDTVGTFEARLRWSNRVRWLAPLAVVGLLVAVAAIWSLLGRRGDAGAERTRAEAVALLAQDDRASVDEAVQRLGAVVSKRPKLRAAAADRAVALVVHAARSAEELEALTVRAAELREDRERARRDQGPGWQDLERNASAEAARLDTEIRAREEKVRALTSGARDQLTVIQAEAGETPEVLRGLALLHALTGERDRLHHAVRAAREKGQRDAWIDLADGWGDARDPERPARERALVKLGALAAARPDLLRGRFLLARAQLSLGRKAEALATAEGVLSANPAHEGARRLREELAIRPAPQAPAPQVEAVAGSAGPAVPAAAAPPAQPPAENPRPRRRKSVSQDAPAPSPAAPVEEPPPSPPAPALAPAPSPAAAPAAPASAAQAPAAVPAAAPQPQPVEPPPSPPVPAPRRRDAGAPVPTDGG